MEKYIKISILAVVSFFIITSCEKEPPAQLELSHTTVMLSNIDAQAQLEVLANGNWTASVASNWCTISPLSGDGNGVITVNATENLGDDARSVSLIVTSRGLKKISKIVQDVAVLQIDKEQLIIPNESYTQQLNISANTSWEIIISADMDWITATPSNGKGNQAVSLQFSENTSYERSGVIEIQYLNKSISLEVTQQRGLNRAPEMPVLNLPLDKSANSNRLPAFRWSSSYDPDGDEVSYIFELSDNPDNWTHTITTSDTLFYLDDYLQENKEYFWRVTAVDEFDNSHSEPAINSFTTGIAKSYFDGEYRLYQEHSKGENASILVFLGDGYQAENHYEGGKFDADLDEGIEAFFAIEPYKSYREYFTVYKQGGYSRESGIQQTDKSIPKDTKFGTDFLGGSSLGIKTDSVFEHVKKIPGVNDESLKNILVVVVANEDRYAGTCWMWSDGKAIAIVPVNTSTAAGQNFTNIMNHEAGGHGFGRLADEYVNSANSGKTLPESDATSFKSWVGNGFYPNVDLTGNVNMVKWKHFIGLPGYSRVSTYEGAYYYSLGAWRSETSSCMVQNEKYYNAPSREAMVKRILNTAGEEFDFELFKEKDIQKSPSVSMGVKSFNPLTFVPLAPPVMLK